MEHSSWENWPLLHTEMGHDDDDGTDFLEHCHTTDDEDFLRDILLQQPPPSPSLPIFHNNNNNNNSTALAATCDEARKKPTTRPSSSSSSPRTFILSFDNSTIIPATPEQQPYLLAYPQLGGTTMRSSKSTTPPALSSSNKRPLLDTNTTANNDYHNLETKPSPSNQGGNNKKSRNDSQTMDHIMAERKRRQELTERFIALSANIPGLKKTDKASILREAINYVKQLQERVTELEKRNKRGPESMIILKKTDIGGNEDIASSETSSDQDCCESLPDVEARVVEKEVLIEIHCEKATGIELKILDQLENLHLSVTGSSVLPFGNSTLGITIIAQMGEAYRMTVNDLVTNLREVLLKHVSY